MIHMIMTTRLTMITLISIANPHKKRSIPVLHVGNFWPQGRGQRID